jgi:aspartate racemase
MKPVGILGGMGPEATILLMQKVLGAVAAKDDADHIPLIVHQNPQVPSRIRRLLEGQGDDPGPGLAAMARDLQAAGASALAMPCNTAHAYAPRIRAATDLPFLDMRQATVNQLQSLGAGRRIGLLASPAVRVTSAFDAAFEQAGFTAVWPKDEGPVLALIRQIKAGEVGAAQQSALRDAAERLAPQCDHLLVACTELSLIAPAITLPWTDSLDCLVQAILAFSRG